MLNGSTTRSDRDLEQEIVLLTEQLRASRQEVSRLAQEYARLAELSTTDELTGLKNYRCFQEILASTYALSQRKGDPLSVAVVAVDDLESFNFAFGRQSGDDVLRTVGQIIQETIRESDVAARYGGKKFVLLFPSSGSCGSIFAAGRIRDAVESHPWPLAPVTVSLGVSTTTGTNATATVLVDEAHAALLHSRRRGFNSVAHHHAG